MARDFAQRASEPQLADGATNPDAVACELYRQSTYWSLLALKSDEVSETLPSLSTLVRDPDVRALLAEAGSDSSGSSALDLLHREDFGNLSERTAEEQSRLLFALRDSAERLLVLLERPENELRVPWLRRLLRIGAVLFALGMLLLMASAVRELREQRSDLAHNKHWRVSSSSITGCPSPQQYCDDSPSYFFHTSEEKDPWVEIDLQTPQVFSAVSIINRRDCCSERASPLVVEVSADQSKWKQVARREGGFRSWRVDFAPQRARYVRVRAVGRTQLHLAAVRILP
jgi:N-acetylgalactosamine 4-sulfate 6-O-sulfotransferase